MTVDKEALWHRLRDDPDFEPSWLRAMGVRPPRQSDSEHRSWGDGVGDKREHIIGDDVSFSGHTATCTRCGALIEAPSNGTLEDLWDLHRGIPAEVIVERRFGERAEMATDDEVGDFLSLAADPAYTFEGGDV